MIIRQHLAFNSLNGFQFELICGGLLTAMGFHNVRPFAKAGQPDKGIDWIFETPEGKLCIAQVKHLRHTLTSVTLLRRLIDDLERGLILLSAEQAILMLSLPLRN